jgi:[FeFe] hydrogenase H-cluster maturation GTPase HydF
MILRRQNMSLNDTPRSDRLHIGFFGKRNSGKSSLINALTGHYTAIVSETPGTTADPVYKSMEIYGLGPCVLIDTAGFDDEGEIGKLRVGKTKEAAEKTEVALLIFAGNSEIEMEKEWAVEFKKRKVPVITILNKSDLIDDSDAIKEECRKIEEATGIKPIVVSVKNREGIEQVRSEIIRKLPEDYDARTITGGVVNEGDVVLLVMPQDIQAPKGRLILPQMQTLRELLDKKCIVLSATTDKLDDALNSLRQPPDVIITDSQVFKTVYEKKPEESKLTSFSILFAGYKGDLDYYVKSVKAVDRLTENSKVLIAEACTHAPLEEDIGREKIPRFLRKRIGEKLTVKVVSGTDFPEDLTPYDLVIQCGACMFNRRYVVSRIDRAKRQGVPMTNYGVILAYLSGILDKVSLNLSY